MREKMKKVPEANFGCLVSKGGPMAVLQEQGGLRAHPKPGRPGGLCNQCLPLYLAASETIPVRGSLHLFLGLVI